MKFLQTATSRLFPEDVCKYVKLYCTLIRDSSLSLTQKISSVIVPATAISWMSKKRNQGLDSSNIEDFEMRVSELETKMSWLSKVFITDKDSNTPMRLQIETRA